VPCATSPDREGRGWRPVLPGRPVKAGRATARLGHASSRVAGHFGAQGNALFHVKDVTGFGESVDQSGGEMRVFEERGPFAKTEVGGDEGGALFVALLQKGEEQADLGGFGFDIPNFVDLC